MGGWGVIPAALGVIVVYSVGEYCLAGIAAALFVVSYIDDRVNLSVYVRFAAQLLAAGIWLACSPVTISTGIALIAAFGIVWVTNLFNFMDGADGLAGGMAFIGFSVFGIVAQSAGLTSLAAWSFALAAASAGFLIFNFPPAKVFLGNAGSVTLGFLAGASGMWGWSAGAWPLWFPCLVAAPFLLDATATLLRRLARREKFWQAHREHYYQRLIRSGWSHRRTALVEYVLMGSSSGLAVVMLDWSPLAQYGGVAVAFAVYAGLACAVDRRWAAARASRTPSGVT
jgi:UDP-N-acetylmuramyl pentapeptide phosphotransferase/UDP-N-acetylglucosamine-1-phosphate transferase